MCLLQQPVGPLQLAVGQEQAAEQTQGSTGRILSAIVSTVPGQLRSKQIAAHSRLLCVTQRWDCRLACLIICFGVFATSNVCLLQEPLEVLWLPVYASRMIVVVRF